MDNSKSLARFKIATVRHPGDGEPKVTTYSIDQLVKIVERPEKSNAIFAAYHHQRSEHKRLTTAARAARDTGDIESAKDLKAQANIFGTAVNRTKFGRAIIPCAFEGDITSKEGPTGKLHRDNSGVTHFSLLMLDVESNTTKQELHDVLRDYEYLLWPTITHRPDAPRFRIVLFPDRPLSVSDAQALIHRIDARLPARNEPGKKLQNLDPVCTTPGQLMFMPKWLIDHPEPYSFVHNVGELVTAESFPVTSEIQASIDERVVAAEEHRTKVTAKSVAHHKSAPSGHPLFVTVNGRQYLSPDTIFETRNDVIRLAEVTRKIGGVTCPLHADAHGSEFIALNKYTNRPQFVCAKCGVFYMAPPSSTYTDDDDEIDLDTAAFAKVADKARANRPQNLTADPRNVHYFNERYLPDISNLVPERGLLVIQSPKGTGKTEALVRLVKSARDANQSVILLTHRRTLARNLASRLGLANYQDLEEGKSTAFMVICINSIATRLTEAAANYDIVIIDESEQVLRNLLAETLSKDLSDIFNKTLLLLQNAKRVICLDADLTSDLTIEVIKLMRYPKGLSEDDDYVGIKNEYPIGAGKTIRSVPTQYQLLGEISRASEAGKRFFVACSTIRAATAIGEALRAQGKRVLLITRHTTEDPDVIEFLQRPNKILSPSPDKPTSTATELPTPPQDPSNGAIPYDAIVASPSLQTGFSIDVPYFDHVFGWFQEVDGITYQDYDQALSRVRHCDNVTVWVEKRRRPKNIDPPELFSQRAKSRELRSLMVLPGEKRTLTEGQHLWARVEGLINYLTALWCDKRDANFKAMKITLGFTVEEIDAVDEDIQCGKLLWGAFKDAGPNYAESVFKARILDPDEYLELKRKNNKKGQDQHALYRYRIADALDQPLTLELVTQVIEGDVLKVVSKARSLILDDKVARARYDIEERTRQHTAFTRVGHRTLEHEILVERLCKAVNVDIENYYARLAAGEEVEIPVAVMDQVVDAYDKDLVDFRYFFHLRVEPVARAVARAKRVAEVDGIVWTPELEAETAEKAKQLRRKRVWDGTFAKVGLPLAKRKRGPRGNQVACYYIDPESPRVKLFLEAIRRAQNVRAGVAAAFAGIRPAANSG